MTVAAYVLLFGNASVTSAHSGRVLEGGEVLVLNLKYIWCLCLFCKCVHVFEVSMGPNAVSSTVVLSETAGV